MSSFTYTFPPMEEQVLKNGLRVILVPDHEQSALSVAFQFPFGRFSDPVDYEGTAELAFSLMQKGTENHSFEEFAEKLEYTGANVTSELGEEHCVFHVKLLSVYYKEILPLFFDMILKPAFNENEFDRLKKEILTSLQVETVDPVLIANRHFFADLAGKTHPAGRFHSPESVKKVSLANVKEWYKDYVGPQSAILVIAGNIDPEKFKADWFSILESWKKDNLKKQAVTPSVQHPSNTRIRLVNKPDLTQTSLVLGHNAPGELNPDKNALALANYVLGSGNFSSRLMKRIRSLTGKTYSINSQISSEREFGAFTITTSTQNSQLEEVLNGILEEYRLLSSDGLTEEEINKAKRFAIGNMAFQLEGIGNVADKLLWLRFYDRPNSYIENFESMINSIDITMVNRVIRTYLSKEHLLIVAVGKEEEISGQLEKFGQVKKFNYKDKV